MTSISAASAGTYQSPLQRLQQELQSEVSAGTISSSDQSALSTALTDIDTALQQSRSSDQSSGTRPSKDDMKSKIDDLISNEVSNGDADLGPGRRAQGRVSVRLRERSRWCGRSRWRRWTAARPAAGRQFFGFVLHRLHQQRDELFDDGGDSPAIPPGASAVAIVGVVVWCQRQLVQQLGFLRTPDRLQELI
ncbi:hypothetical protein ACVMGF_001982 [Bradyrhizobium diazoefficiens]